MNVKTDPVKNNKQLLNEAVQKIYSARQKINFAQQNAYDLKDASDHFLMTEEHKQKVAENLEQSENYLAQNHPEYFHSDQSCKLFYLYGGHVVSKIAALYDQYAQQFIEVCSNELSEKEYELMDIYKNDNIPNALAEARQVYETEFMQHGRALGCSATMIEIATKALQKQFILQ